MKRICNLSTFIFLTIYFMFILVTSCKTEDLNKPKLLPILTTTTISQITQNTASTGGIITSDGGLEVSSRGVCWSLQPNPTTKDSITKDATGTGEFTSRISNLIADTTYYVRAYASNSDGTAYGLQVTFKTLASTLPVLTTIAISDITISSATSGGNIIFNGGIPVTSCGVCWSELVNPTIDDKKTIDGVGVGSYISFLTGLKENTRYYIRSYATNGEGTGYGSEYQFTTSINPLSIKNVLIPAGKFIMGSSELEVNRNNDETQYSVTLDAFRMSKYEITNAQYAAFLNEKSIGSNGIWATAPVYCTQVLIYASYHKDLGLSWNYDFGLHYSNSQWVPVAGYENAPVINVTWYGASEYATYVGGTLPTEAQWEYACRAGTVTPFNTGSFLTNAQANYQWAYPYNGGTNTVTTFPWKTQAVGTYASNAYGLYDMHGNVNEWCADWYDTYPTTAQTNPTGATSGSHRVTRGGYWFSNAQSCRSAFRSRSSPSNYDYILGFRVVFVP